ncbi:hypothetical protein D3C76_47660 [compost metagenome]
MTKDEKAHLSRVVAIGCIACLISGMPGTPAEVHHPRAGVGKGKKASHFDAIPLCPAHHRGTMHPQEPSIHLAKRAFIERFGTEAELLERVRQELGDA